MKSRVTLYYKSLANKEKNFVLDDGNGNSRLETYLNSLQKVVLEDFQYTKHQLSLSIKIDSNQTNLEMVDSKDLNYVKIQNYDGDVFEKSMFYFVISKVWRAKNTIELVLSMDTLNSFKFNEDYQINSKTLTKRMHKDRFEKDSHDNIIRKIDLRSEDISCPVYKTREEVLNEKEKPSVDWALYYKNSSNQDNAPIDCFLVPAEAMKLYYQQATGELNPNNVPLNKYLIFYSTYPSGALIFKYGNSTFQLGVISGMYESGYSVCAIFNNNGVIEMYVGGFYYEQWVGDYLGSWTKVYTGNVTIMNSPESVFGYARDNLPSASQVVNEYWRPAYATTEIQMGALVESTLYGNTSIDKTLETNVKIINIPYSPTPYEVDENEIYTFDACWTYNSVDGKLKLTDFGTRFVNTIITPVASILNDFVPSLSINTNSQRTYIDSKLFHSDYYRPKFVYDSFHRTFPLEQINYEESLSAMSQTTNFEFTFVMSRNIVSKFLFKFNFVYNHANEDYPNIVAVARNNEEVLYNSQYLNYIRTGYNYDLKAKERQEGASVAGLGVSIGSLIASIALSASGYGTALGVAGIVGSVAGITSSLISYAKTTAQNEDNIQRKLQETQRQAVSVLNADDYDLLYEYTQNRAKLVYYEVSQNMKNILDDLFYYAGYIVNEQMIPEISSRYWFNFVQATLVINDSSNLTSEIEDDIKEKFEQGVTFLHYHDKFDFKQEMENWETSLLE